MANISTSIELYDRVSAPINRMIAAMGNMCTAFESVESSMDSSFDTSAIEEARRATEQAALEVIQLGNDIEQNQGHQENFNRSVRSGGSAMDGLTRKVAGLVATYVSLQTVSKAMDLSDQMTQTTARLDMMNDGLQTTEQLQQMIFASAQRSRGSYQESADAVAKMGIMAKDAFNSNAELVAFVEQLNKQFTIAGTSQEGVSAAMLQLTQAMSSGVLRGEELNSVFEQAPTIIQSIADYLDVPIGSIREMAAEGQLTSDIVKNALLSAAEETDAKFAQMPMTWGQVFTSVKNQALMAFQPVLDKINEIANNPDFQVFAQNAVGALSTIAMYLLQIMEFAGMVAMFIGENWSIIEPIIMGIVTALGLYAAASLIINTINGITAIMESTKAAAQMMATGATLAETAAQHGLNAALMACPLTWIILLIIAVIAIIYAVCSAIAKLTGVANSGFGVITGGINVVIQFFKNLGLSVANIALGIGNAIAALGSNMMTAFNNAICSIQSWFYGLLSTALSVVEGICAALNKLPFVEFDYSGISAKADEYAAKSAEAAGNKEDYKSIGDAFNEGFSTFETFQDGWAADAFASGAAWGDGVADSVSGAFSMDSFEIPEYEQSTYDASQIPSNIADTAGNTGAMKDSMDITSEDLKYLRDIAETEVVNRFTTAEIKVEMTNNNNVSSDMDLDGIVDYLATGVNDAMEKAARG
ncbi:MAG: tape measure protein [Methanocorpusculum sp.]|nr:tape measure protein [Methanocorpusculum sp.]